MTLQVERAHGLEALGIVRSGRVHWNLSPASLYEAALRRGEGTLAAEGPIVARTGQHTGRSPNDKFVVKDATSDAHVKWGTVNKPIEPAKFDLLHRDMMAYVQDKELYVLDAWASTADGASTWKPTMIPPLADAIITSLSDTSPMAAWMTFGCTVAVEARSR